MNGFQLVDFIIMELKDHMTCDLSHWLKLQHSDWRENLGNYFFFINFPPMRALKFITDYVIHTRVARQHCYKKKAALIGQNGRLSACCNFFSS